MFSVYNVHFSAIVAVVGLILEGCIEEIHHIDIATAGDEGERGRGE